MAIDIIIVQKDLHTTFQVVDGIEDNDDYSHLRKVARELGLLLIASIDAWSNTVINKPQLEILSDEIQQLRNRTDINQEIIDKLQNAIDTVRPYNGCYLRFIGE